MENSEWVFGIETKKTNRLFLKVILANNEKVI
jgi:hypothetical protein